MNPLSSVWRREIALRGFCHDALGTLRNACRDLLQADPAVDDMKVLKAFALSKLCDHLQSLIENNQELEATKRLEGDVFAALDAAVADLDTDNVSALSMRLLIDKVLAVR